MAAPCSRQEITVSCVRVVMLQIHLALGVWVSSFVSLIACSWSTESVFNLSCPFSAITCSPDYSGGVQWSSVQVGVNATGSCVSGYFSAITPQRYCLEQGSVGVWQSVTNPCSGSSPFVFCLVSFFKELILQTNHFPLINNFFFFPLLFLVVYCPVDTTSGSSWNQTQAGNSAVSSCNAGFYSSVTPSRVCGQAGGSGVWSAITNACTQVFCSADSSFTDSFWSQTAAGQVAIATCNLGYFSSSPPQRNCSQSGASGIWGSPSGQCSGNYCCFVSLLMSCSHLHC